MTHDVTFVVFGATGHLARTKLLPSLAKVVASEGITNHAVVGVGSRDRSVEDFTDLVATSLADAGVADELRKQFMSGAFGYCAVSDAASFGSLADAVASIEQEHDMAGNRILYLAIPPSKLDETVQGIADAGMGSSNGWVRLVVEKPFGVDFASAENSNAIIHATFDETQVYRIDHFLGKETVRNLLVFRFANSLFEQTWNRRHIHSVEITVAETAGLDGRAAYFDESGTVRDMVQNHLTQILTLIAMEPPVRMNAASIHIEKVKVLNSMRPITTDDVVLGQYGRGTIDGHPVIGYHEEPDVPSGSATPTFAALRLHVDNWRWHGVPFYLRTGKRMSARVSEVTVRYLTPPVCLFHHQDSCEGHQNVLTLRLQPGEGFELLIDVKQPGPETRIGEIPLAVDYDGVSAAPDAYETLLADIIEGDQTLFVRADEVEAAWALYEPLLDRTDVHPYAAGTDGPDRAERLITTHPRRWSGL